MDDAETDIRTLFAVLRRQIRLIIITFIVVVTMAGLVILALTPTYSSSALILFDPSSKDILEPETQLASTASESARIDSEVELLRSDNILLKVIAAENLMADPEFAPGPGIRNQLLSFLRLANLSQPTGEAALDQTLSKVRKARFRAPARADLPDLHRGSVRKSGQGGPSRECHRRGLYCRPALVQGQQRDVVARYP